MTSRAAAGPVGEVGAAQRWPAPAGRRVERPGEGPLYEELARRRRRAQIAARHALEAGEPAARRAA